MWLHTINIYDTQYLTSLSKQHPLNCTTENASGSLGLKKNHRIQESVGLGSLPSAGPGPDQVPVLFTSLFLGGCPRERCWTNEKVKEGKFKSHFFFKKAKF